MRNILISLICFGVLQGCTSSKEAKQNCITILLDVTDSFSTINRDLEPEQIMNRIHFQTEESDNGLTLSIAPITNMRFNRIESFNIPPSDFLSSNEVEEKRRMDTFNLRVKQCILRYKRMKKGLNQSAIFESISEALKTLCSCKECGVKKLIVLSDLRQNNEFFSSYDSKQMNALITDPKSFEKKLDYFCPLPQSLKSISLEIIHQPASTEEDILFLTLSTFAKSYYESKGAKVKIATTF